MKRGEFEIIDSIAKRFRPRSKRVLMGVGDDTAILRPSKKWELATTDMMVEGVHFDLTYCRPEEVGYKAIAINVSDIIVKGGAPTAALVSLAMPQKTKPSFVHQLYDGIARACREYRCTVVGGNLSRTTGPVVIDVALLGDAKQPILRSGAGVDDSVVVSGTLGDSAGGLFQLRKRKADRKSRCVRRHLTPRIRVSEASRILRCCDVTAAMDLSDSLANALHQLGRASRVGFEIDSERVPLSKELKKLAEKYGKDPLEFAFFGGEDYELLLTVSERAELPKGVTAIGRVVGASRGISVLDRKGRRRLPDRGWDHFN